MPFRTLPLILLFLSFTCVGRPVGAAAANEPPGADDVEQIIANTLPGYWKVDQLSLSDPVDYGNPVEPEWRWRYEAFIAPKEPLYVESGHHEGVEGVVLLELTLGPESPQTLYGVAVATFHAGRWSGEARHENRPFDHGGQPASFFPGRTVVVGSPEERELREATRQRELDELEAKLKAEREAKIVEHQDALATAKDAHRAALERLKADHDADRERRAAEHQNELAVQMAAHDAERERREAEQRNELARAAVQHAGRLAALEAGLKAEAEQRRVEITESEKLTEVTAEARDRLAALQAAEAERFAAASDRLTALQAEEAEMLAASERFHEARRVALKKLFDRLGVMTGPDDYLALLDTASESELDWMRVAVLRHGLGSDDLASSKAAWRHLLQADDKDSPDLRGLLADHMEKLKDSPDLRKILADHMKSLKDSRDSRDFVDDHDLRDLVADHMERHDWIFVDLEPRSNTNLVGHEWWSKARRDSTLSRLPINREADFEGPDGKVKFKIIDGAIVVFGTHARQWPKEVEGIVVEGKAKFIYFLHATGWEHNGVPSYVFVMNYRDGRKEKLELISGFNSDDWCHDDARLQDENSVWGWVKKEGHPCGHAGLITTKWENPRPDIWIDTIDIVSLGLGSVPVIAAITLGEATLGLP